ncbi:MAG: DMT family transporter [Nitrospinae bacterium]|nr:DMT family transporter [Nitrospinota bacterium]
MLWVYLSLIAAFCVATQDTVLKKSLSHLSHYEMIGYPILYSLPFFLVTLISVPVPPLDATFYWSFIISIPLNALAIMLYVRAIKISPLSLTVPFLSFTSLFVVLSGWLMLGEVPNLWGLGGIGLIVIGSYVLNIRPGQWSILDPFRALSRETGSKLMFAVAVLFSLGSVLGKVGILHSSPLFFQTALFVALDILMIIYLLARKKIHIPDFKKEYKIGIFVGLLFFTHIVSQGFAITLTKAAYMISIKRLSILFSVFYGWLLLGEDNIRVRFIGASFMFAGSLLITILG